MNNLVKSCAIFQRNISPKVKISFNQKYPALSICHTSYRCNTTTAENKILEYEHPNDKEKRGKIKYVVSEQDFKWVEMILPSSRIPDPPKYNVYPTPTGWRPPHETKPDLPYHVGRTIYHYLSVLDTNKRTQELTRVYHITGDIWALEKELIDLVRPYCKYEPATRVHEGTMSIFIKGHHAEVITEFLYEKGF